MMYIPKTPDFTLGMDLTELRCQITIPVCWMPPKTLDIGGLVMHLLVASAFLLVCAPPQYEVELSLVGAKDIASLAMAKLVVVGNEIARAAPVSERSGAAAATQKILTASMLFPAVTVAGTNPRIGVSWAVKVQRLDDKRVLLHLAVQDNEVRKAKQRDAQVVGTTLRAVKQVEVGKAVKLVLSSQRVVWATVKQTGVKQAPEIHELVPAPRVELK
jgi:hypothetical protein